RFTERDPRTQFDRSTGIATSTKTGTLAVDRCSQRSEHHERRAQALILVRVSGQVERPRMLSTWPRPPRGSRMASRRSHGSVFSSASELTGARGWSSGVHGRADRPRRFDAALGDAVYRLHSRGVAGCEPDAALITTDRL